MGDTSTQRANDAERERLRALVGRLSERELEIMVDDHWTVAGALAHLAFWDARNAILGRKLQQGVPFVPGDDEPEDVTTLNDAMRPLLLAIPPAEAARLALALAEQADSLMASLDPSQVWPADPRSPVNPLRAGHRREHLDEIEAALRQS